MLDAPTNRQCRHPCADDPQGLCQGLIPAEWSKPGASKLKDRWSTEDPPDLCRCEDTSHERYRLLDQRIVYRSEVPDQPLAEGALFLVEPEGVDEVQGVVADVAVEVRSPAFKPDGILGDKPLEARVVVARPTVTPGAIVRDDLTSFRFRFAVSEAEFDLQT
jgi:hypothetical protein